MTALAKVDRAWLNQRLQTDFRLFLFYAFKELHGGRLLQPTWHIDAMCHALEVSAETPADRLLITIGPRHLKPAAMAVEGAAALMMISFSMSPPGCS